MRKLGLVLVVGCLASAAREAQACGGCFHPPEPTPTVVTGHRMAFSVSETQTVLWDQFEYQGDPSDFSWVLPVRPTAYVEVADDAWLSSLDAFTSPIVAPPTLNCATATGGCACGGMSADDSAGSPSASDPGGVQIVRQERVGPYDTVVLQSADPNALRAWLETNNYIVPDEISPVIDAYVSEGYDFLALRLSPGLGVEQMEPVRVITPGGPSILPLRMVAAGVGSMVDIKLFVIAEQRYAMPDLAEVSVKEKDLSVDFSTNQSNYLDVRNEALAQNAGRSYVVPYAHDLPFTQPNLNPDFNTAVAYRVTDSRGNWLGSDTTLAGLYFKQAAADVAPTVVSCPLPTLLGSDKLVVSECEAGASCPADVIPMSNFECHESTDLATALVGMHPSRVWLTRFELNLPAVALDHDCVLEPALTSSESGPFYQAAKAENAPCEPALFSAGVGGASTLVWGITALLWRRFARRREQA